MKIRTGGVDDPQIEALLRLHRDEAHATTPAGNAHALAPSGLSAPGITLVSAWDDGALLGVGAIKRLGDGHAELKSMRTAPTHLRRGVGSRILAHLIDIARAEGLTRISLETGTAPMFAAANAMYEAAGFVDRDAFGDYPESPHNRFMTRDLDSAHR